MPVLVDPDGLPSLKVMVFVDGFQVITDWLLPANVRFPLT